MPSAIIYKNVPITIPAVPPAVTVERAAKVGAPGEVNLSLMKFTAELNRAQWTAEDLVNILIRLHNAGAIKAKVEVK